MDLATVPIHIMAMKNLKERVSYANKGVAHICTEEKVNKDYCFS